MTLGRTADNKIKIKTDGGLRAVNCACCGPCNFPPVCLNGIHPNDEWSGDETQCSTTFPNISGCSQAPPIITNAPYISMLCGGPKWALLISGSVEGCLGNTLTNFYCKNDGIDSPIGTYYGYNYGGDGYLTFTVTEKEGESC